MRTPHWVRWNGNQCQKRMMESAFHPRNGTKQKTNLTKRPSKQKAKLCIVDNAPAAPDVPVYDERVEPDIFVCI